MVKSESTMRPALLSGLIDGCFARKARKSYPCAGDGTPNEKVRKHADGCVGTIVPTMGYMEFEPMPHSAGSRHCWFCASAFFKK